MGSHTARTGVHWNIKTISYVSMRERVKGEVKARGGFPGSAPYRSCP